jgi:hypothetical protein
VRFGTIEATLSNGKWRCGDDAIKDFLDLLAFAFEETGYDPNPDYHLAMQAVEALGGEMVEYDPTESEPGVDY